VTATRDEQTVWRGRSADPLEELRIITSRLRLLGLQALVLTIGNLAVALLVTAPDVIASYAVRDALRLTNIAATVAALALLGVHEGLRKRGDALFQELSDELQWFVGRAQAQEVPADRPALTARVALRSFATAVDLPLFPGARGAATYAFVNIGIAVLAVTVARAF
jgi:hypothetical protein